MPSLSGTAGGFGRCFFLAAGLAGLIFSPRAAAAPDPAAACLDLLSGGGNYREELTYAIKWKFMPAGTAILSLAPQIDDGRVTAFRIESTARSNSFIDAFYPVRNSSVSIMNGEFSRSLYYASKQREGTFKREEIVEFDTVEGTALLFRDGNIRDTTRLPPEYGDPNTGMYRYRRLRVDPQAPVSMFATDGRRLMLVRGEYMNKERIETPAGSFNTFKVELFPEELEGPFKRKKHGRVFLWFSDDDCRIPVKMASDVFIGAVETVLEKAEYRSLTVDAEGKP